LKESVTVNWIRNLDWNTRKVEVFFLIWLWSYWFLSLLSFIPVIMSSPGSGSNSCEWGTNASEVSTSSTIWILFFSLSMKEPLTETWEGKIQGIWCQLSHGMLHLRIRSMRKIYIIIDQVLYFKSIYIYIYTQKNLWRDIVEVRFFIHLLPYKAIYSPYKVQIFDEADTYKSKAL
jgi:hypothetical protein